MNGGSTPALTAFPSTRQADYLPSLFTISCAFTVVTFVALGYILAQNTGSFIGSISGKKLPLTLFSGASFFTAAVSGVLLVNRKSPPYHLEIPPPTAFPNQRVIRWEPPPAVMKPSSLPPPSPTISGLSSQRRTIIDSGSGAAAIPVSVVKKGTDNPSLPLVPPEVSPEDSKQEMGSPGSTPTTVVPAPPEPSDSKRTGDDSLSPTGDLWVGDIVHTVRRLSVESKDEAGPSRSAPAAAAPAAPPAARLTRHLGLTPPERAMPADIGTWAQRLYNNFSCLFFRLIEGWSKGSKIALTPEEIDLLKKDWNLDEVEHYLKHPIPLPRSVFLHFLIHLTNIKRPDLFEKYYALGMEQEANEYIWVALPKDIVKKLCFVVADYLLPQLFHKLQSDENLSTCVDHLLFKTAQLLPFLLLEELPAERLVELDRRLFQEVQANGKLPEGLQYAELLPGVDRATAEKISQIARRVALRHREILLDRWINTGVIDGWFANELQGVAPQQYKALKEVVGKLQVLKSKHLRHYHALPKEQQTFAFVNEQQVELDRLEKDLHLESLYQALLREYQTHSFITALTAAKVHRVFCPIYLFNLELKKGERLIDRVRGKLAKFVASAPVLWAADKIAWVVGRFSDDIQEARLNLRKVVLPGSMRTAIGAHLNTVYQPIRATILTLSTEEIVPFIFQFLGQLSLFAQRVAATPQLASTGPTLGAAVRRAPSTSWEVVPDLCRAVVHLVPRKYFYPPQLEKIGKVLGQFEEVVAHLQVGHVPCHPHIFTRLLVTAANFSEELPGVLEDLVRLERGRTDKDSWVRIPLTSDVYTKINSILVDYILPKFKEYIQFNEGIKAQNLWFYTVVLVVPMLVVLPARQDLYRRIDALVHKELQKNTGRGGLNVAEQHLILTAPRARVAPLIPYALDNFASSMQRALEKYINSPGATWLGDFKFCDMVMDGFVKNILGVHDNRMKIIKSINAYAPPESFSFLGYFWSAKVWEKNQSPEEVEALIKSCLPEFTSPKVAEHFQELANYRRDLDLYVATFIAKLRSLPPPDAEKLLVFVPTDYHSPDSYTGLHCSIPVFQQQSEHGRTFLQEINDPALAQQEEAFIEQQRSAEEHRKLRACLVDFFGPDGTFKKQVAEAWDKPRRRLEAEIRAMPTAVAPWNYLWQLTEVLFHHVADAAEASEEFVFQPNIVGAASRRAGAAAPPAPAAPAAAAALPTTTTSLAGPSALAR